MKLTKPAMANEVSRALQLILVLCRHKETESMSWDVTLQAPGRSMGSKEDVREAFLAALEDVVGKDVPRRGPTEVNVDSSFRYAVHFIGHRRAIESLSLEIQVAVGDPHHDAEHPVWSFLRKITEQTGWEACDTYTGTTIDHYR
jgi:hypothetical protein